MIKNKKCKQRNQVEPDDSKCREGRETVEVAGMVGDDVPEVFSESVSEEETPVHMLSV